MQTFKQFCTNWVAPALQFGQRQYVIGTRTLREERQLSEGGFGFVSCVRDVSSGETFALKRILCQEKERYRVARAEAKLMESLPPHPNIVGFFGAAVETVAATSTTGSAREVLLLLELCEGGHLLDLLDRHNGSLKEEWILHIVKEITAGLAHLHSQPTPVAHRDLKIENVLCCEKNRDSEGRREREDKRGDKGGREEKSEERTGETPEGKSPLDFSFKLCDFGSSNTRQVDTACCSREELLRTEDEIERNTTLMYRPPEMVDVYRGLLIGPQADMWIQRRVDRLASLASLCGSERPPNVCPVAVSSGLLVARRTHAGETAVHARGETKRRQSWAAPRGEEGEETFWRCGRETGQADSSKAPSRKSKKDSESKSENGTADAWRDRGFAAGGNGSSSLAASPSCSTAVDIFHAVSSSPSVSSSHSASSSSSSKATLSSPVVPSRGVDDLTLEQPPRSRSQLLSSPTAGYNTRRVSQAPSPFNARAVSLSFPQGAPPAGTRERCENAEDGGERQKLAGASPAPFDLFGDFCATSAAAAAAHHKAAHATTSQWSAFAQPR